MRVRRSECTCKQTALVGVAVVVVSIAVEFYLLNANAHEGTVDKAATTTRLPKDVVIQLIQAAQANDLDGVLATTDLTAIAEGRHGRRPSDLIGTLRDIDLKKTRFVTSAKRCDPLKTSERVKIEGKYFLDFDLELRTGSSVSKNGNPVDLPPHYVVVSVHP